MGGVPKEKQAEEGIKLAIEQVQEIKEIPGIKGFHIMAIEWEEKVPEIVQAVGLYPRPKVNG
jgi:methylenetetrahydrofolate reductase (NADPH)